MFIPIQSLDSRTVERMVEAGVPLTENVPVEILSRSARNVGGVVQVVGYPVLFVVFDITKVVSS